MRSPQIQSLRVFQAVESDPRRKPVAADGVQARREIAGVHHENAVALFRRQRAVEPLAYLGDEPADGTRIAENAIVDLQVSGEFVGLDLGMFVIGAIFLLAFGAAVPFLMQARYALAGESQGKLLSSRTPEQDVFDHRLDHLRGVGWNGNGDPEVPPDPFGLPDQNVKHSLVDFVVASPDCHAANFRLRLSEAIDAAFALFEAIGIPREIVVDDGVEFFLEIDALTQTIGRNKHVAAMRYQVVDALSADLVGIVTCYCGDFELGKLVV